MCIANSDVSVQEGQLSEAAGTMQLVSFRLGQEEYGIKITQVQEIILMGEEEAVQIDAAASGL